MSEQNKQQLPENTGLDIGQIKPGMTPEQREQARAEIAKVLKELGR